MAHRSMPSTEALNPPVIPAAVAVTDPPAARYASPKVRKPLRRPMRYANRHKQDVVCLGRFAIAANVFVLVAGVLLATASLLKLEGPAHWTAWLLPVVFAGHVYAVGLIYRMVRQRRRHLGNTPRAEYRAWREVDGASVLLSFVYMPYPLFHGVESTASTAQLWGTCAFAIVVPVLAYFAVRSYAKSHRTRMDRAAKFACAASV
jgi:hypothetical protein